METELPQMEKKKKEPTKRGGAKKKAVISDDDEDDIEVLDDEFEPVETKKKGGRKAAAAKPPAGAKKRGPASKQSQLLGQKLITEVLQPAAAENSPEKKVRKMRASPFNKKSSSILGRTISVDDEEDEGTSTEVAPKARPQRGNRTKATYVISDDSEGDAAEDFDDDSDASVDESDL